MDHSSQTPWRPGSDEARSLDAEIRRQTSIKALKRNESCQNEEIKNKGVIVVVKVVLMGFFKNF